MNAKDDLLYYRRRADQERAQARACRDQGIAQIHLEMASAYDRRIAAEDVRREFMLVSAC